MIQRRFRKRCVLVALSCALPICSYALPEDDAQQIASGDYASLEYSLDTGEMVQKAHAGQTTCITQGSREICGVEIRIELTENDVLKKVTATGMPARFAVQPEANQEVAHFAGRTLVFDNEARLLTIDGDAEFSQGNTAMSHEHIEYDLNTRNIRLDQGSTESERQGRALFTPGATGN
jgi:lipopolysaccharide transport protein LptA